MTKFAREQALVHHLLNWLGLNPTEVSDPNASGSETGIDVRMRLSDRRVIGIQVTEVDPYDTPGKARKEEKDKSKTAQDVLYGMWAQNDPRAVVAAIARSTERKVKIAARHSFTGFDEVWLLICAGIPELGAAASTFVMTPWLSADDMNSATSSLLEGSKYNCCYFLPILGAEQTLYEWEQAVGWKKAVKPRDIRDVPREAYVRELLNASDPLELRRLVHRECTLILRELRRG